MTPDPTAPTRTLGARPTMTRRAKVILLIAGLGWAWVIVRDIERG